MESKESNPIFETSPNDSTSQEASEYKASIGEYRKLLIASEQKSQEAYDKTLIFLSTGLIAISMVFAEKIAGPTPYIAPYWLITSWTCSALSMTLVVISYYFSLLAMRKAIDQVDNGEVEEESSIIGGCSAILTDITNAGSGLCFLLSVFFLILFSAKNIG